jgi:hypothetical protein
LYALAEEIEVIWWDINILYVELVHTVSRLSTPNALTSIHCNLPGRPGFSSANNFSLSAERENFKRGDS